MLNRLTLKLCPLLTMALATVGCGKKINEPKTEPARTTENQELPSTMIFELDGTQGSSAKTYTMPQNGTFHLPEQLRVRGNALNKSVEIIYELDPEDPDTYQFKCKYLATATTEMRLNKCYSWYGSDLGNISDVEFGFRKGDAIQLRFTGASASDLKVEAIYSVEWR